jgi:hypothetical protein
VPAAEFKQRKQDIIEKAGAQREKLLPKEKSAEMPTMDERLSQWGLYTSRLQDFQNTHGEGVQGTRSLPASCVFELHCRIRCPKFAMQVSVLSCSFTRRQ